MSDQTQELVRYDPARPPGTAKNLKALLNSATVINALKDVTTKVMTPERVVKMLVFAASKNPALYQCTPESWLKAAMTSAETGLDCSGTLGRAYVVPYGKEATFIPGYLGLIDLIRRSKDVKDLIARLVYEGEDFDVDYSWSPPFKHKPNNIFADHKDSEILGGYFYATFHSGGYHFELMSLARIEKARAVSPARNGKAWTNWYPEMCLKTLIRRGAKFCPLSVETQELIAKAEENEYIDIPSRPTVERGTLNIEDLQPTDHAEDAPIDVEPEQAKKPGPSLTDTWQQFKLDLKRKKVGKEGLARADYLLAEQYGTTDLSTLPPEIAPDAITFEGFLKDCTRTLEEEEWLK